MNYSIKPSVIFACVIMLAACRTEKESPVIGLDIPDFWQAHKDQLKLLAKEIELHGYSEDVEKKARSIGCEQVMVFPSEITFVIHSEGISVSGFSQDICYERLDHGDFRKPPVDSIDDEIRNGNNYISLSQILEGDWRYVLTNNSRRRKK